jgi:transposase
MTTHISARPHLTREEIESKMKETVGFWRVKRWLVIWNALVDPRPAKEIALHLGLSVHTVHNLISMYNRHGSKGIETHGKGCRKNFYLSFEEEVGFLKSFEDKASSGQIATALEIKAAYEKIIGHKVHKTTVYRMLKRHGWRKVMPRPFYVDSKKGEQESFKKNSPSK